MKEIARRAKNLIFSISVASDSSDVQSKDSFHLDFEDKTYRQNDLCDLIRDTVIFFALTEDERDSLNQETFALLQKRAWNRISDRQLQQKGDYGELLLFLILEVFYPARKFVTKVRLRTSRKDEIKGYDCAHFAIEDDEVSLWLGEAKFHKSFSTGIFEAIRSIKDHLKINSIKQELSILEGNVEILGEEREILEGYLQSGISVDKMNFKIPILITYDSKSVANHNSICDEFLQELNEELTKKYSSIENREIEIPSNVILKFILLPLETVEEIKKRLFEIEKAHK